jgi:hypothetical protein
VPLSLFSWGPTDVKDNYLHSRKQGKDRNDFIIHLESKDSSICFLLGSRQKENPYCCAGT